MSIKTLPATLVLVLALGACGHQSGGEGHGDTQVVAKVNDQEISVHQLNLALGQAQGLPPERLHAVAKQTLDKLVEQDLLAQQAIQDKLDRDPKVVQMLEAARREVLARAYVEHAGAEGAKPTKADIDGFFDKHPELFSARRIYRLQQLQLQGQLPQEKVKALLEGAKTLGDVARGLAAERIPFNETTTTVAPEQLPLKIAQEFSQLKIGNIVALPTGNNGMAIAQILTTQDAAVTREQAAPAIERFLSNEKRSETLQASVKALHDKAKVVYLGEFDPSKAPAAAPVPPAASAAPAATPAAAAPAEPPTASTSKILPGASGTETTANDSNMAKGISGLK